jgi:hypothetical protein
MIYNEVTAKRLNRLGRHLLKGKLGHKKFDFRFYNVHFLGNGKAEATPKVCGTAGCAIGECPILFPDMWQFSDTGFPELRGDRIISTFGSAREFFGLEYFEFRHLFVPKAGHENRKTNPNQISGKASRKVVGRRILNFVRKQKHLHEAGH